LIYNDFIVKEYRRRQKIADGNQRQTQMDHWLAPVPVVELAGVRQRVRHWLAPVPVVEVDHAAAWQRWLGQIFNSGIVVHCDAVFIELVAAWIGGIETHPHLYDIYVHAAADRAGWLHPAL
jgi:hypothetical protein